MALNSQPLRLDGWLFDGKGADVVIVADGGWPSTPTLKIGAVSFTPTIDGNTATWTLTAAQAATALGTTSAVSYTVTLGTGDAERVHATGWLQLTKPGKGRTTTTGPATLIVGPPASDGSTAAWVADGASLSRAAVKAAAKAQAEADLADPASGSRVLLSSTYAPLAAVLIGTDDLPATPLVGETVTILANAATVFPVGTRWDSGGEPAIDVYDEMLVSLTWRGDVWIGTYGLPIPIPDTTPPTAGTLAASAIADTGFTLTASGATDDRAVTGYSFDTGAGTFGNYQTSPALAVTGKTAGTTYTCRHKARDAAGNESTGASIQVRTVALAAAIMALSPDAYWKLDETSGTVAADSSGHGLTGTYTGTYTLGGAAGVTLAGGHVAIADADALSYAGSSAGFTIFALGSRPNPTYPAKQYLTGKAGSGYEWAIETVAGFTNFRATAYTSGGTPILGEIETAAAGAGWHAICAALPPFVNGARFPLYRDSGTEAVTTQVTTSAGNPTNTASPVWIGGRADSVDKWTGSVRHVAIFRTQLSAAQVGALIDAARADGLIP